MAYVTRGWKVLEQKKWWGPFSGEGRGGTADQPAASTETANLFSVVKLADFTLNLEDFNANATGKCFKLIRVPDSLKCLI